MKEIIIKSNEAGQRFDKYLKKYLSEAPGSFIYKMLRKKNIVLNGKKADGSEKLSVGDSVKLFFSDETYMEFSGKAASDKTASGKAASDKTKSSHINNKVNLEKSGLKLKFNCSIIA